MVQNEGLSKDGNIKIDNNLAENAIRPLTLSRKNFLFCGNHEAAENTAVICSLLATCKAQEVNPREWLNDVIARLPYYQEKDSGKYPGTASGCLEVEEVQRKSN